MKYLSFIICAVVFVLSFNGCAANQSKSVAGGKMPKQKKTFAQTLSSELAALAEKPFRTIIAARQDQARMEKDNSVVETTYDAFGNKTESRVFYNDSLLKMVVLQTSADGQQQAFVYAQNGEVKSAPQNLLGRVLTSIAGEIAKAAEIYQGRKEEVMMAKLETVEMPPTDEFSIMNLNQPTAAETTPIAVAEPTKETVPQAAPVEQPAPAKTETAKTVEAEDNALKLRAVVQALKATRVSSPAKNATVASN